MSWNWSLSDPSVRNAAILSGASANNLFQQCQVSPLNVKTQEQAWRVNGAQFGCLIFFMLMLRKHWTNQDVYRRDLPVSIIMILIAQHGVFPCVWLNLHKWISNHENCPKLKFRACSKILTYICQKVLFLWKATGQKSMSHGWEDGLVLLCQTLQKC